MSSRSAWIGILFVGCALVLAGAFLSTRGTAAEDNARRFTLIYNINNSGYVDVCGCKHKEVRQGSLTRRSSFLKQIRATGRDILLLDGGSTLFHIENRVKDAEYEEAVRKARLIVDAYNHMGYQAMAVGAFELAAGLDELLALAKRAKFPFLSANLANRETGELYFKPHEVFKVGDVRVGVIGLTLDTLTRPFLDQVAPNAELLDPIEAARKSVAALRDQTDLIIGLTHVREETTFKIAAAVPEIRFALDPYIQYGSHHTWIKEHEWLLPKEDTWILRTDGQGARMGVLDIELHGRHPTFVSADFVDELAWLIENNEANEADKKLYSELRDRPNRFWFTRVSLEPHHLTDPEIDRLVSAWKENIDPSKIDVELTAKDHFTTHDKCRSCHKEQYEFWLSTGHAKAWDSLVETGDQHRFDCVGCHSLGYGQAFLNTREVGNYAGVQCESCHLHAEGHIENPTKNRHGRVKRLTCVTCHNEEQTKAEFVYTRVRHLVACPLMESAPAAAPVSPSSSPSTTESSPPSSAAGE